MNSATVVNSNSLVCFLSGSVWKTRKRKGYIEYRGTC